MSFHKVRDVVAVVASVNTTFSKYLVALNYPLIIVVFMFYLHTAITTRGHFEKFSHSIFGRINYRKKNTKPRNVSAVSFSLKL